MSFFSKASSGSALFFLVSLLCVTLTPDAEARCRGGCGGRRGPIMQIFRGPVRGGCGAGGPCGGVRMSGGCGPGMACGQRVGGCGPGMPCGQRVGGCGPGMPCGQRAGGCGPGMPCGQRVGGCGPGMPCGQRGGCGQGVACGVGNNRMALHTGGGTTIRIGGFDVPAGAVSFDPNSNAFFDQNGNQISGNGVVGAVAGDGGVVNPTVADPLTTSASGRPVATGGRIEENIPDLATYNALLNRDKGFRNIVVMFSAKLCTACPGLKGDLKRQFANSPDTALYIVERDSIDRPDGHEVHKDFRARGDLNGFVPGVAILSQDANQNWTTSAKLLSNQTFVPTAQQVAQTIPTTPDGRNPNRTVTTTTPTGSSAFVSESAPLQYQGFDDFR